MPIPLLATMGIGIAKDAITSIIGGSAEQKAMKKRKALMQQQQDAQMLNDTIAPTPTTVEEPDQNILNQLS